MTDNVNVQAKCLVCWTVFMTEPQLLERGDAECPECGGFAVAPNIEEKADAEKTDDDESPFA